MRVFILFKDERYCIDVDLGQTVGEIKQVLRRKFDLDTVQNGENENDMLLSLRFAGGSLEDEWIYSDLSIPSGVTLRCETVENVKSYLNVFCVYSGDMLKFTEPFTVWETKVSHLRTMIMDKTGLHVSVFRLVSPEGIEMFDCNTLNEYNINIGDVIRLETWDGWANFLKTAARGHLTPTLKNIVSMADDPLTAKYQLRVALFMAAHFGYPQLAAVLLKAGARSDEPIGEHPIREWCNEEVHVDHLKTPVHEAAQQGHLICLRQFIHHNYACILVKDGNGLTPCNIARRYKNTECFKLLIAEQFRSRSIEGLTITIYAKIKKWSERAKDRASVFHKHNPSPLLLAMEKRSYRKAAVGQKVYVDGFGKRLQTSATASKVDLALVHNDQKKLSVETGIKETNRKTSKEIKVPSFQSGNDNVLQNSESVVRQRKSADERRLNGRLQGEHIKYTKQLWTRESAEFLPAVSEPRCQGNIIQQGVLKETAMGVKRKKQIKQFECYRWKESEFESLDRVNVEGRLKENNILPTSTNRRQSTPLINVNGNKKFLHSDFVSSDEPLAAEEVLEIRDDDDAENERVFVTETSLGLFNEEPLYKGDAWSPDTEKGEEPAHDSVYLASRMPPITQNGLKYSDIQLHHCKRSKPKEHLEMAKSDDGISSKTPNSLDLFSKSKSISRRRTKSEDPSVHSTAIYRHVTGLDIRESAKASLKVATTFNKMSWLQQVQLAMDFNKNTFRRYATHPKPKYLK